MQHQTKSVLVYLLSPNGPVEAIDAADAALVYLLRRPNGPVEAAEALLNKLLELRHGQGLRGLQFAFL